MGRMMGAFDRDNDMLDRPDLNKCPDCGCFFAQDNCPLCGKPCPEDMRAGKRAAPKKEKYKYDNGYRTVMFVDWYHRWWFIALMAFTFPLIAIVLLITSPHKKTHKIIAVAIAAVYMLIVNVILPIAFFMLTRPEAPVDTSLTKEEYIAKCEQVSAEDFYRNPEKYYSKFIKMDLTVVKVIKPTDYYEPTCYICKSTDGGEFEIIVRSYLQDEDKNLIAGDKITVYGEGAGIGDVYDINGNMYRATILNMAYVTIDNIKTARSFSERAVFHASAKKLKFASKMYEYS